MLIHLTCEFSENIWNPGNWMFLVSAPKLCHLFLTPNLTIYCMVSQSGCKFLCLASVAASNLHFDAETNLIIFKKIVHISWLASSHHLGWFYSPNSSRAEWGSQFLLETVFVQSWFPGSCWFRLWFPRLSPSCLPSCLFSLCSKKQSLFHHDFLVPPRFARVPALVSLLVSLLVSSLFAQKNKVCAIMISWFLLVSLGFRRLSPFLSPFLSLPSLLKKTTSVPSWFPGSSWFRLWFRPLSPFLSSFLSFFLSLLFLLKKGVCSIMISWFLLVPALVSPLVSRLVFSFFAQVILPPFGKTSWHTQRKGRRGH